LSNLDAALRHDTRVEIARLHSQLGATTIYVTHDQVEAMTLADKIVVLRDGEVMQVGAPMDLFNMPANEFVAGFLGSPTMNFFAGELTSKEDGAAQGKFNGSGITTDNVRLVSTSKAVGDAVKLGIRPQHLELDAKGPLQGTVSLVERLGTETIVELVAADKILFRFATSEESNLAIGLVANFSFDPTKVHIF
jgi:ABC-type sugar transport system ATPase subunit